MTKIQLHWEFYKSTVVLNILFSLAISLFALDMFAILFPISLITVGPALSLFYNEITHQHTYYFYYNKGISKIWLMVGNLILNTVIGISLVAILSYV